jgi:hypothetical protein
MYDDDNDKDDLDFYELTQVLVMGKKWVTRRNVVTNVVKVTLELSACRRCV